jgi:hypothetical protein
MFVRFVSRLFAFRNCLFLAFVFLTALFWAHARDPFRRVQFSLKTQHGKVQGVAILPRSAPPRPIVIFFHGAGGGLVQSGLELKQLAELNLGVVDVDYDQTNETVFEEQFIALRRYLSRQSWLESNKIAWVGVGTGAQREWDLFQHRQEFQPQLFISFRYIFSGLSNPLPGRDIWAASRSLRPSIGTADQPSTNCSFLFVHSINDELYRNPVQMLQAKGYSVDLRTFPDESNNFRENRLVIMRGIAEYCASFFDSAANSRDPQLAISLHPLHLNSRASYWYYWIPAYLLTVVFTFNVYLRWRNAKKAHPDPHPKLSRALTIVTCALAIAASVEMAVHLGLPRMKVSETTLSLTRRWLVDSQSRSDFDWLAQLPIWQGEPVKVLLEHLELTEYNRGLINRRVDKNLYREFVLSPVIVGGTLHESLKWRRTLWENFYPRVRYETDPVAAAQIVSCFLRQRVTIVSGSLRSREINTIWAEELTDTIGFDRVYTAALRAVGIPSRLNDSGQAELFSDGKWQLAPRPIISEFLPFHGKRHAECRLTSFSGPMQKGRDRGL